ncbi:MAG: hypothetical protein HQL98_05420 [Magnetococcales bacterium]|nr:hypothetical protein [Magnetococcales bacterium]
MIKVVRGLLVGLGLGFALLYASDQSLQIYLASLALMVLVGLLIPLEQQERQLGRQDDKLEQLLAMTRAIDGRLHTLEERVEALKILVEADAEDDEEEDEPAPRFEIRDDPERDRYFPAIQSSLPESRSVMGHGRRTVERSVEDVARKLASMQRGD